MSPRAKRLYKNRDKAKDHYPCRGGPLDRGNLWLPETTDGLPAVVDFPDGRYLRLEDNAYEWSPHEDHHHA